MKSPYVMFLGPIGGVILGVLFRFRVLPFLKSDTILSGGREVPTLDFANFVSCMFFVFAAASFALAVAWSTIQRRKRSDAG